MIERETSIGPRVLTMQIIAAGLILGVLLFAGITLALGAWHEPEQEGLVKYVGLGLIAVELLPFLMVPSFVTAENLSQTYAARTSKPSRVDLLLMVCQTRMIIRFALVEGAAFLNLIAFMTEHAKWSLGVAGGLVLVMLAMFPTRTKVAHWIEAEQMRGDVVSESDAD
jgi:hypothetical protein